MAAARTQAVPPVIGHRGAAGHAPENTIASVHRAAALGAAWVEFDCMLTRDGEVVVIHDETLERTTDGQGAVADHDLAEIKTLDAGGWFDPAFAGERVPTLGEMLAALAGLGLGANVEIKPAPGRETETGRQVAAALARGWPWMLSTPLVSSFREDSLAAAREVAPEIPRALLVGRVAADWRRRLDALACAALHCRHRDLTEAQVAQINAAGFPVRAYTVNDRARADTLWSWGVESVFSDYPDRLL